jgi:hypothetical protein
MGLVDPTPSLATILARPDVRRGGALAQVANASIPTGFLQLDAELPGGGWPTSSLTELLPAHEGIGELRLLGPALARLSRAKQRLAWIAPPYLPYAPALNAAGIALDQILIVETRSPLDTLWAVEQALTSAACGAVLAWPGKMKYVELRRLQLAAEHGTALAVLFRPPHTATEPSPAALRLSLVTAAGGLAVHFLKRRGAVLTRPTVVNLPPPHAVDRRISAESGARSIAVAA